MVEIFFSGSTAQAGLYVLRCTCLIYITVARHQQESLQNILPKLVEIQSILLASIVGAGIKKKYLRAYRMVNNFLNLYSSNDCEDNNNFNVHLL